MTFSQCLSAYMDKVSCNAAELSSAADIAPSTISRYLNSSVTPSEKTLLKLAKALSSLSRQNGSELSEAEIFSVFSEAASGIEIDYEHCVGNLKQLLSVLNVTNHELARSLSYDPSYISRILSGSRKPANLPQFLSSLSLYLAGKYFDTPYQASIMKLTGNHEKALNANELAAVIRSWLGKTAKDEPPQIARFLEKLDAFDLNEFMASLHFEDLKVPTVPFQLPTTRFYRGIPEMMQAELDFLKSAVLSKSKEDVILYSDMPMEEMSKDPDFPKKWMFGMAMLIRKGLQLQNIHDVHRPISEMLLGLEGWIPMYMTGQVSPFYLKEPTNHTFLHFIRSAGAVAIAGEAIFGQQGNGRYIVTRNREDVAYYRTRAEDLLHRALPLMQIYRKEQKEAFQSKITVLLEQGKSYRRISNAPPLFTMSSELLAAILKRNAVPEERGKAILSYHRQETERAREKLQDTAYLLELPEMTPEEREKNPVRLPISELFPDMDIRYTEDEYLQHLEETEGFSRDYPLFSLSRDPHAAFRNIDITICPGKFVLVSKSNPPTIHFLIYHPKMVEAFEQFVPPIIEERQ